MKAYASTLKIIGVSVREEQAKYRAKRQVRGADNDTSVLVELRPGLVPFASVQTLADKVQVESARLLSLVGLSGRTAARRKVQGYLEPAEADRLLRIARVVEEAMRIFGSEQKVARWLNTPHPALENVEPLAVLDSDAGVKTVSDELVRIDFGDYA
jgi:putative toxin-antitoxin system antitoxin component (TIGR02293 family)